MIRMSSAQFQRESVTTMLQQQTQLSRTQQQLATGRRVLTPADDPAAAARALDLTKAAATFKQYNKNAEHAKLRLSIEESVLGQATNLLQRVRELTVQANNATNDSENRRQIGAEIEQRLDQLIQLANSTDGAGEYLFSGYSTRTEPFAREGGAVRFQGDQGSRMVQVGPSRQLPVDHSGFEVFMKIPNGNGTFVINQDPDNAGTGLIDNPGVVLNANAYTGDTFTIAVNEDVDGNLQYEVTDSGGDVVADGPFVAGEAIQFAGIAITLTGKPADGDSFTVEPSRSQSIFRTLQNLLTTFQEGGDRPEERAAVNNGVARSLSEVDLALENLLRVRSEVGGRLNALDSEIETNDVAMLDITSALSTIEDLDYAEAISKMNQQLVGLQASQQSYMKIQGLSLFNFMR